MLKLGFMKLAALNYLFAFGAMGASLMANPQAAKPETKPAPPKPKEEVLADPELSYVFKAGDDNYKSFRIPAIVATKKGTLLAFAEGRVNHSGDHGDIDIVAKRSNDGGKTWSKLIMVRDNGKHVAGNPAPVVDQQTGRIYLVSCASAGSEGQNMAGTVPREVFFQYSDDDGVTWSEGVDISAQAKKPEWGWFATGPCNAIQIREGKFKGRLVIPSNLSEKNAEGKPIYKGSNFYSDDQGKSWKIGSMAADGCNESTVAEVKPDLLVQNFRMQTNGKGKRTQRFSTDGGVSWTAAEPNNDLYCCVCQGSILRDYAKEGVLYFSNPSKWGRNALVIRKSEDGGQSWPLYIPVYDKRSGYSNVVMIDDKNIGVLFEGGINNITAGIAWKAFPTSDFKPREK